MDNKTKHKLISNIARKANISFKEAVVILRKMSANKELMEKINNDKT